MDRPEKEHVGHAHARAWRMVAAIASAGALVAGGGAACDASDDGGASATSASSTTFGAEVVVSVKGGGRVTTSVGDLSCPGTCFTRVYADRSLDGSLGGLTLVAEASLGFHFVRWKLDALDVATPVAGPRECSPMKRATVTDITAAVSFDVMGLPFGETTGTPPRGYEDACAGFTKVPIAYAVTAIFEADAPEPMFDASTQPTYEVVFEPPPESLDGPALDLGLIRDLANNTSRLYWRFKSSASSGSSGVATGIANGGDTQATTVIMPTDVISLFHVDANVVVQHASHVVDVIEGITTGRAQATAPSACIAAVSDGSSVYCRVNSSSSSTLFEWQFQSFGAFTTLLSLPPGRALAYDATFGIFYYSEDYGVSGSANLRSVSRPAVGDGGAFVPVQPPLVTGLDSPHDLIVNANFMFWLDDLGVGTQAPISAFKAGDPSPQRTTASTAFQAIAADPNGTTYWLTNDVPGAASIIRIDRGPNAVISPFVMDLDSVNGIAVDNVYIYWTQNDGRVYRAPKFTQVGD